MEQLTRNLQTITGLHPDLAKKLEGFTPQNIVKLAVDHKDLSYQGEPFYHLDADIACKAQVAQYLAKPLTYSLRYKTADISFARHQMTINKLNEKAQELGYPLNNPHTKSSTLR